MRASVGRGQGPMHRHGIERVFEGLRSADGIALLDGAEAQRVRDLGWRRPILLLEGVWGARPGLCFASGSLARRAIATNRSTCSSRHKTHVPHRVFLKMNSGAMNRLGFTPDCYHAAWARLNALPRWTRFRSCDAVSAMPMAPGRSRPDGTLCRATRDLPGKAQPQQQCGRPAPFPRAGYARQPGLRGIRLGSGPGSPCTAVRPTIQWHRSFSPA